MSDRPPPLDYATPQSRRRSWLPLLMGITVVALGVMVGFWIFLPSLNSRALSPRAKCSSNMHQIGLAILLYQNDFGGMYPPSLDEVLENEQITPQVYICPSSNDAAAAGPTTQAILADVHKPGHLSYIYIGQGLTDKTATDDMVVLYEPLTNHAGDGRFANHPDQPSVIHRCCVPIFTRVIYKSRNPRRIRRGLLSARWLKRTARLEPRIYIRCTSGASSDDERQQRSTL